MQYKLCHRQGIDSSLRKRFLHVWASFLPDIILAIERCTLERIKQPNVRRANVFCLLFFSFPTRRPLLAVLQSIVAATLDSFREIASTIVNPLRERSRDTVSSRSAYNDDKTILEFLIPSTKRELRISAANLSTSKLERKMKECTGLVIADCFLYIIYL